MSKYLSKSESRDHKIARVQTKNNNLLKIGSGTKNISINIQGLMVWHSMSRQCILTAVIPFTTIS